jgi:predicted SpoU family rRNA methylase
MATWLTFTGIIVTVESDEITPHDEVAALARKKFLDRVASGVVDATEVGVGEIEIMSSGIKLEGKK